MVHQEYSWKTEDYLTLYGQSWMPESHPRAMINYVHGFKDYGGRFERWALRLTDHGYGVIAVDLRGHGHSPGRRGYASGFESYLHDVHAMRYHAQECYPGIPQILYGHSLGGNIVANYLMSRDLLPDTAVITSPWFTLASKPSVFTLAFARMFRFLLPGLMVRSDLDRKALSRDKEIVEAYSRDPLVHNSILPRLYFEIEEYGIRASESVGKINLPLLVMHGTADRITSCEQTRGFSLHAGNHTTFKEWPGSYHELHNDTNEQEVFDFVLHWLDSLKPGKS
jgi:acylglycerol lipase